ncbi:hypothetical protein CASFOL_014638 [Castilleja foliolosa]|uniref:Uncharacterized protein n=1 Tax=Castilleja foliolosa TaxID=1961234 RepID=A0ABD3DFQ7_9LAMI
MSTIYLRIQKICIDVARCPSVLRDLFPQSRIEDVKNNPTLLQKMVSVLQDSEDFHCPICISPPMDIVITCCAHMFCMSCILKTLQTKPNCPMCRHHLSASDLFKALFEPSRTLGAKNSSSSVSSKVDYLIKLLTSSRDAKPSSKSVIFSQFREMLLMLEEPFKELGFNVIQLMSQTRRANVFKEFNVPAPEGPTILLASLKALNVGINLTAASTVYLLEPWWNQIVEERRLIVSIGLDR